MKFKLNFFVTHLLKTFSGNKVPFLIAGCAFIVPFLVGLFMTYPSNPPASKLFMEYFSIKNRSPLFFMERNGFTLFLLLIGAILFGISTFFNLVANGLISGSSISIAVQNKTYIQKILFLTIPHGIFEIPAIIIAGAAGFKIPYEIVRYLAGKKEQILTKEDIKEYLTLALISIILIIIAAWIEANVTLKIAKAMLNSTKGI